ncbi:STAS domain-containing protein [Streptomyces sp. NPDC058657]|uniref:STAS domain-containing protein n=1 Tax=unclassified Streptomyces TaxID=2593676 RepID=UPI003660EC8F
MTAVPFRSTLCGISQLPHRCLVLVMPYEVDLANYEAMYAAVCRALELRHGRIDVLVLDFTGTAFTDSRGARLVSATREYAARAGVTVRLAAGEHRREGGVVRRVVTLTGLRRDVPVYGTVREAVAGVDEVLARIV